MLLKLTVISFKIVLSVANVDIFLEYDFNISFAILESRLILSTFETSLSQIASIYDFAIRNCLRLSKIFKSSDHPPRQIAKIMSSKDKSEVIQPIFKSELSNKSFREIKPFDSLVSYKLIVNINNL